MLVLVLGSILDRALCATLEKPLQMVGYDKVRSLVGAHGKENSEKEIDMPTAKQQYEKQRPQQHKYQQGKLSPRQYRDYLAALKRQQRRKWK